MSQNYKMLDNLSSSIKVNYINGNKYAYCKESNFIKQVLFMLYKKRFIINYSVIKPGIIKITLKYKKNKPFIRNLTNLRKLNYNNLIHKNSYYRISKKYKYFFVSTPKGLFISNDFKKEGLNGIVFFSIDL